MAGDDDLMLVVLQASVCEHEVMVEVRLARDGLLYAVQEPEQLAATIADDLWQRLRPAMVEGLAEGIADDRARARARQPGNGER